jgi:hypothetical protein
MIRHRGIQHELDGTFQIVEDHVSYQVIRKPRIVVTLDLVQKCNTCGKEMSNCIEDHVLLEHPEVKANLEDSPIWGKGEAE